MSIYVVIYSKAQHILDCTTLFPNTYKSHYQYSAVHDGEAILDVWLNRLILGNIVSGG